MNNSIRYNKDSDFSSRDRQDIFDLTKLREYPLRLLYIKIDEKKQKSLYYKDVKISDLFHNENNNTVKFLLIGSVNRTNLSSEYIFENVEELYEAIQKYIAGSLLRRSDPLEYYIIGFTKLYDLRAYKRLFAKGPPLLQKTTL